MTVHLSTATTYAEFAAREARGSSPAYERLSLAVSRDRAMLARLDRLPLAKRQPNLLFAASVFSAGRSATRPPSATSSCPAGPGVEAQMRARSTQTNETGRCALLLPVLAALPQPLALLEIGASAGLNLFPDRYAYRYGDRRLGPARRCSTAPLTGAAPPAARPR